MLIWPTGLNLMLALISIGIHSLLLVIDMLSLGPIMLDLKGVELDAVEKECLTHPACGGVILFARNIESAEQVFELNRHIHSINPNLLLAVDQEGGRVQRLKQGFSLLPPLRKLSDDAFSDETINSLLEAHASLMALETLAVGFDISFTPVLDVATSSSRVIGDRAFHEEPEQIVKLAKTYISAMKNCGMAATGKHFPGHGTVDADSHVEIPVDARAFSEIEKHDLKPFAALANDLAGVMPAHVVYSQIDPNPAGFSEYWIKSILRHSLGFNGVVFSDDLSMKGAEVVGDFKDRADAALQAGCDMVLVCNSPSEAEHLLEYLESWRNTESQQRILLMKAKAQFKTGLSQCQSSNNWQVARAHLSKYFSI